MSAVSTKNKFQYVKILTTNFNIFTYVRTYICTHTNISHPTQLQLNTDDSTTMPSQFQKFKDSLVKVSYEFICFTYCMLKSQFALEEA